MKAQKKFREKIGKPPGTLIYTGKRPETDPLFTLVVYQPEEFHDYISNNFSEIIKHVDKNQVNWLNIDGIANVGQIEKVGSSYGIHSLVLEDIVHVEEPPKIEVFDDYIFVTLKSLMLLPDHSGMEKEHISFILGKHFVISFQEDEEDTFKVIRERISGTSSRIKQRNADYLLYVLIDVIVDNYYLVLEHVDDDIEVMEDDLTDNRTDMIVKRISHSRKILFELRRHVSPLYEAVRELKTSETNLIDDNISHYYNDLTDHLNHLSSGIHTRLEQLSNLMEINLSLMNNRMNQVMYTLTLVTAIFIPLTFLVGVYGMNFKYMPELEWRNGYFYLWGVMVVIGLSMFVYMKRKRWF